MKNKTILFILAVVGIVVMGCNHAKTANEKLEAVRTYLAQEAGAYQTFKSAVDKQGESSVKALHQWLGVLNNLQGAATEFQKFYKDHQQKVDENSDTKTAIAQAQSFIDKVFDRHYSEVEMKLVPPWQEAAARSDASGVSGALRAFSSSYQSIYGKSPSLQNFDVISVSVDSKILDTQLPCIDKITELAKGRSQSKFCVDAAKSACGHQIHLDTLATEFAKNTESSCAVSETVKFFIPAGKTYDYKSDAEHINSSREEYQRHDYGETVTKPNQDRTVSRYCLGDYNESKRTYGTQDCGYSASLPVVSVYGYDRKGHVDVNLKGLHSPNDTTNSVRIQVFAGGSSDDIGEMVPTDITRTSEGYTFTITKAAFQEGTSLKLRFVDLLEREKTWPAKVDGGTPITKTIKVSWVVNVAIHGEDIKTIDEKEVILQKWTPNKWLAGVIQSCAAKGDEVINK